MKKGGQGGSRGALETGAQGGNLTRRPGGSTKTWLMSCLSMLLLVVQGTLMSVVLRYSRIHGNSDEGSVYLPSVSVGISEGIKLLICIAYLSVFGDQKDYNVDDEEELVKTVWDAKGLSSAGAMQKWMVIIRDSVPMALPASMFVFQQVLLIWSATYLDAVTYQIFTQAFKLIPTAIFARVLLGQRLRPMQWASIPVLALGVIFITSNSSSGTNSSSDTKDGAGPMYFLAMAACSISGLSSAYAGVYFEKYVKGRLAGSLVKRNFQLSLYGVPFSWLYALIKDGRIIRERGPLNGFGVSAWGVIWLQVFGGFIIALVVKYCDNILKNFALAGSVIMTVLVSIPLFGQWPSSLFLLGVSIVLGSIFMYGGSFPRIKMPSFQILVLSIGICVGLGTIYMFGQSKYAEWSALKMSYGT